MVLIPLQALLLLAEHMRQLDATTVALYKKHTNLLSADQVPHMSAEILVLAAMTQDLQPL